MSTEPTFLPSRDLRDLRTLDLASSECLDSVRDNLTSLARLLGASGGQIVHAPPQLIHSPTQPYTAEEPAVEHAPREVDAFETTYVTRWLSRLVSEFTMISPQDDAAASQAEQLSEQCAALLALSAGRMAAGASVQKHIFQLDDGVLEVQLRDGALIHDSLGTHTWGAAPILSQLLLPLQKTAAHDLKVLELGAGTGLVGLSVAAWARQHPGVNTTHVICTDYHPTVLENLAHNIMLNGWSDSSQKPQQEPKQNPPCVLVTARCLDWQSVHRAHLGQVSDQAHEVTAQTLPDHRLLTPSDADWAQTLDVERLSNTFDMLVAADCVYDPLHPFWIRSVAEKLLKKPEAGADDEALLHVMVPLRPTHQQEVRAVYQAFEPQHGLHRPRPQLEILCEQDYQGYENFGAWNAVVRSDSAAHSQPEGGLARTYRWFQIGWR